MATAVRSAPWDVGYGPGVVLTLQHYRIYTTASRHAARHYLPGFMEASYRNYLDLTGLPDRPDAEPMVIYVMGSRREWASLTEKVVTGNPDAYLAIEAGGYFYPGYGGACVFWDTGGTSTFSVAAHEGLHQFLARRLRDRLPMWLEEGLCVLAEGFEINGDVVAFTPERNPSRYTALLSAIVNDRWIPLRELLPMDAGHVTPKGTEHAVGYYGQLWALAMFIRSREDCRGGLGRMLADAGAGRFRQVLGVPVGTWARLRRRGRTYNRMISEPLFRRYIAEDLEVFDREYLEFAKRLVRLDQP